MSKPQAWRITKKPPVHELGEEHVEALERGRGGASGSGDEWARMIKWERRRVDKEEQMGNVARRREASRNGGEWARKSKQKRCRGGKEEKN